MPTPEKRGHNKSVLELKIYKNIIKGINEYLDKRLNNLNNDILKNIHDDNDHGFTINFAARQELHDFLKHIEKLRVVNEK